MMTKQKIKDTARKNKKKISQKAIKKINNILEHKTESLIKKASRNADFSGRIIIKEEDIVEEE